MQTTRSNVGQMICYKKNKRISTILFSCMCFFTTLYFDKQYSFEKHKEFIVEKTQTSKTTYNRNSRVVSDDMSSLQTSIDLYTINMYTMNAIN